LLGRVRYSYVGVFLAPSGEQEISRAVGGSVWYICALAGSRYLVAQDYCHSTTPLGWINVSFIEPLFVGQFPAALVTPFPTLTPPPPRPPTPTYTPTQTQ
jgi:hypothetical protein